MTPVATVIRPAMVAKPPAMVVTMPMGRKLLFFTVHPPSVLP